MKDEKTGLLAQYLRTNENVRNLLTGVCVGLADIVLCYPLAVLATRVECGTPIRLAIAQGNLYSGGWTCGTLLIPYSACVEGGSKYVKRELESEVAATMAISAIATFGMQIIEKKLTMDQMLQDRGHFSHRNPIIRPLLEIKHYTQLNGVRALGAGIIPLACRESMYVSSITVVNPIVTKHLTGSDGEHSHLKGVLAAFGVGLVTGLVTAPFQTLSAMMKFDKNRGQSMFDLLRVMFRPGVVAGVRRISYGAATRSVRLGGAGILYFEARHRMQEFVDLGE